MKNLLTIRDQDVEPNSPVVDSSGYRQRRAARAVLTDGGGQVYLEYIALHKYHKLPGGGIEAAENILDALKRELIEEIGCKGDVVAELGIVLEYRDFEKLIQTSYSYLAKQVGEQGAAALEESEMEEGLSEVMAANIDDAINILENDQPDNIEGRFIRLRDLAILKAAKSHL